jgi:LEA14-like dessication related protein
MIIINPYIRKLIKILIFLGLTFILECASVQNLMNIKKPGVSVQDVRITHLTFASIDLSFIIAIENPNALSVSLAGFDYNLILDNNSFLKGEQEKTVSIESRSTSQVEIPLQLTFQEIYNTFSSLSKKDSSEYEAKFGLNFNLPILGNTRIPINKKGKIPLLRLPSVRISSLKLKSMGITTANLELDLQINNSNPVQFLLNQFQYNFQVAGNNWANGITKEKVAINPNSNSEIKIPIELNFLQIGQSAYQLINRNNQIDYQFDGNINFDTSSDLLKNVNLPINTSDKIDLTR